MISDSSYPVLAVSLNDKFVQSLVSVLSDEHLSFDRADSVGAARRMVLRKEYAVVLIDTPMKDEFGANFALDIASDSNLGVLLFVEPNIYDEVSSKCEDLGILTLAKPAQRHVLRQSVKLLLATRRRLRKMEKKNASFEEKIAEIKTVNRAKLLLMENESLSEADAHRQIEKLAMDTRRTKLEVANDIISRYTKP